MEHNQYTELNAVFTVDGYYIRSANQKIQDTFDRAKQDAILNLQKRIEAIERLSFEKWTDLTGILEARRRK